MSRLAFLAALTLAAPAFAQAGHQGGYVAEIEDLPLPPGLSQAAPARVFDAAAGRLVLAEAEGEAEALAVRDFYYETLPQLGWAVSPRADGVLMFQRGRERLTLTLRQEGGRARLGVQLAVLPVPAD